MQSLVLSKWASTSSSGFPGNSSLKCDQFKCTTCCPCACGVHWTGGCGACGAVGGGGTGVFHVCNPCSAISFLILVTPCCIIFYSI